MLLDKTNLLPESDARHHSMNLAHALKELAAHARDDIQKIDQPGGKVLLETTAEVLLGLAKAHDDFVAGEEEGMKA